MDKSLLQTLRVRGYTIDADGHLGKGSFAEVFKATRTADGIAVAIKQIHRNRVEETSNRKLLESEIAIMKTLSHENIVRLVDTVWEDHHICLVMEYCNGGDLGKYIAKNGPLTESMISYFGRQIASALSYLHSKRIVHRDLKPQNILLDFNASDSRPTLRIADFGFARHLSLNMADTFCGSPLYMAPEVLFSDGHDEISDLWGAGAVLYQCLTKNPPFKAKNIEALKAVLRSERATQIRFPRGTSLELQTLITGLLQVRPRDRMRCVDFYQHPFLDRKTSAPIDLPTGGRADVQSGLARGSEIPYGDAPATPSPQNSGDSNTLVRISSELHGGAAGREVSDGGSTGDKTADSSGGEPGASFVLLDRDTVQLDVLVDNLEHRRKQATRWTEQPRWRESHIHPEDIDAFEKSIRNLTTPAGAIVLAAKEQMDHLRSTNPVYTAVKNVVMKVEVLNLFNRALQLLRVGMEKVRGYLQRHDDAILFTERGGQVVALLRDKFNECFTLIESVRRQLPDDLSRSQYGDIEVKSTEELLYEYAVDLTHSAADLEMAADYPQAVVIYSRILVIFKLLTDSADAEDKAILLDHITATQRRLEAVNAGSHTRSNGRQMKASEPRRGDRRTPRNTPPERHLRETPPQGHDSFRSDYCAQNTSSGGQNYIHRDRHPKNSPEAHRRTTYSRNTPPDGPEPRGYDMEGISHDSSRGGPGPQPCSEPRDIIFADHNQRPAPHGPNMSQSPRGRGHPSPLSHRHTPPADQDRQRIGYTRSVGDGYERSQNTSYAYEVSGSPRGSNSVRMDGGYRDSHGEVVGHPRIEHEKYDSRQEVRDFPKYSGDGYRAVPTEDDWGRYEIDTPSSRIQPRDNGGNAYVPMRTPSDSAPFGDYNADAIDQSLADGYAQSRGSYYQSMEKTSSQANQSRPRSTTPEHDISRITTSDSTHHRYRLHRDDQTIGHGSRRDLPSEASRHHIVQPKFEGYEGLKLRETNSSKGAEYADHTKQNDDYRCDFLDGDSSQHSPYHPEEQAYQSCSSSTANSRVTHAERSVAPEYASRPHHDHRDISRTPTHQTSATEASPEEVEAMRRELESLRMQVHGSPHGSPSTERHYNPNYS